MKSLNSILKKDHTFVIFRKQLRLHLNPSVALSIAVGLLLLGCVVSQKTLENDKKVMARVYNAAMADAAYPEPDEVYKDLVAITSENKDLIRKTINGEEHILVVSWKAEKKWYVQDPTSNVYNTGNRPIWVSVAPNLQNRLDWDKVEYKELRLQQLLGLPPTADYKWFVEFWVKPEDLFRPCPDPEITDKECKSCGYPDSTTQHAQWLKNYRANSYYECELYGKYPWTQLGYTYDWFPGNKTHVGLSEFVIKGGCNVVVKGAYATDEYLKRTD